MPFPTIYGILYYFLFVLLGIFCSVVAVRSYVYNWEHDLFPEDYRQAGSIWYLIMIPVGIVLFICLALFSININTFVCMFVFISFLISAVSDILNRKMTLFGNVILSVCLVLNLFILVIRENTFRPLITSLFGILFSVVFLIILNSLFCRYGKPKAFGTQEIVFVGILGGFAGFFGIVISMFSAAVLSFFTYILPVWFHLNKKRKTAFDAVSYPFYVYLMATFLIAGFCGCY